ncbi:MAG TPA: hypothetical protein PKD64_07685 [Pirellulaceae bacterium]|nr:hypothetical protein [Pirellulaceae bacterium]HMO92068.1 hypothetical protein [Pirellulaceae bacterium]HMP69942.1 hypothetical protein [Pirellulaceae bacterium]
MAIDCILSQRLYADLIPLTQPWASPHVGDEVIAIGFPRRLAGLPTVTRGIVSALDRSLDSGGVNFTDLIQTDAAIRPRRGRSPFPADIPTRWCGAAGIDSQICVDR